MFLLDTNVISALRRPDKTAPQVVAWAQSVDHTAFFLSAVTILEIEMGILALESRDPAQAMILRQWFDQGILLRFERRILPIDAVIARSAARLHVPDRRPERDALIAATAQVHRLTVVTRNVVDFLPMGVSLLNPWDAPQASGSA
jgi:toxin FitB